jgi:hypothetical protein
MFPDYGKLGRLLISVFLMDANNIFQFADDDQDYLILAGD